MVLESSRVTLLVLAAVYGSFCPLGYVCWPCSRGTRMDVINLGWFVDMQNCVGERSIASVHGAEKLLEATGSGPHFHAGGNGRIARGGALTSAIVDWRRMRVDAVGGDRLFSARDP